MLRGRDDTAHHVSPAVLWPVIVYGYIHCGHLPRSVHPGGRSRYRSPGVYGINQHHKKRSSILMTDVRVKACRRTVLAGAPAESTNLLGERIYGIGYKLNMISNTSPEESQVLAYKIYLFVNLSYKTFFFVLVNFISSLRLSLLLRRLLVICHSEHRMRDRAAGFPRHPRELRESRRSIRSEI